MVFVIQNNHWAISVPLERQTASETLAQKAFAYGIEGRRVDGNDVIAVYLTVKQLIDEARSNFKPALVELVTYRMDDHTTADDASRYRTEEMLAPWRAKDPIDRMRKFLTARHGWDETKETELVAQVTAEIEQFVQDYERRQHPEPANMFDHMYAELPWNLQEQRAEVNQRVGQSER